MRLRVSAVAVCLLLLLLATASARAQDGKGGDDVAGRREGRVRAPELEGGRGWLNTERPLTLAALRGKVVLLDFWTYGCINCMHVIPDLKRLEEKYPKELVVIGVHSAKFENEKETENIRRIILRYQHRAPGRQRRRLPHLERLRRARVADAGSHRPGRLRRRLRLGRGQLSRLLTAR